MKKPVLFSSAFVLLLCLLSPAQGKDRLIAYPVPFNQTAQTLKLKYELSSPVGTISVDIYDINGDKVFTRQYSDLASFKWKGYNDAGKTVGPGLYIIRVKCEDLTTGAVRTDTVRILLKR